MLCRRQPLRSGQSQDCFRWSAGNIQSARPFAPLSDPLILLVESVLTKRRFQKRIKNEKKLRKQKIPDQSQSSRIPFRYINLISTSRADETLPNSFRRPCQGDSRFYDFNWLPGHVTIIDLVHGDGALQRLNTRRTRGTWPRASRFRVIIPDATTTQGRVPAERQSGKVVECLAVNIQINGWDSALCLFLFDFISFILGRRAESQRADARISPNNLEGKTER